jgi:hypothetical protein
MSGNETDFDEIESGVQQLTWCISRPDQKIGAAVALIMTRGRAMGKTRTTPDVSCRTRLFLIQRHRGADRTHAGNRIALTTFRRKSDMWRWLVQGVWGWENCMIART